MMISGADGGFESRIEQALLWLQRITLGAMLLLAVVGRHTVTALILGAVLLVHGLAYYFLPRVQRKAGARGWRRWGTSVLDVVLVSIAFHAARDVMGAAGILGLVQAGILAARVPLWPALGLNLVLWVVFSFPFLQDWFALRQPLAQVADIVLAPLVANLLVYPAITFAVSYLASAEARQARVDRQVAVRMRQLAMVQEVGRTISSTLDLESVLTLVVSNAVELLDAEGGSLLLREEAAARAEGDAGLVFRVVHGTAAEALVGQRLPPGKGIAGAVMQTGQPELVADVAQDGRWDETSDAASGFETRSILAVPLVSRGQSIGVLEVVNKGDGGSFNQEDLELLSSFAPQAAVALENARLYEETDEALSRRLEELSTIEEIDHELGATLDYNRIVRLVLRRAVQACGASSGAVGVLADGGRRLEVQFWHSGDDGAMPDMRDWPVERGIVGRVLRSGRPALVADVTRDPDYLPVSDRTASQLAVPIRREEQTIGILNLESDRPAAFSFDDLRFLEHLAEHAAIAIENARLFREQERRASDLATLNQVSTAVTSKLDPDQVLETIVDSVIEVAGCQKSAIFVLEGGRVSLRTSRGLSDAYVTSAQDLEVTPGSRAQAVLRDEPLVVPDIETDPELRGFVSLARSEGFRGLADLPLHGRGANVGGLTVYYAEPHHFTQVELDTLKTFANQAAIAIENARMFQAERQQVQMLSAIGEIGREIRASLDLERTLNLILTRIRDLVDYYIAEICLWDEETQILVTWASAGDPRYTAQTGGFYRMEEGYTGWIARNRRLLLISDIDERHDVRPKIDHAGTNVRSYVGLPLETGEAFVGTLELASNRVAAYDEGHLEVLRITADQAAVAIQNARLYEETQKRYEETQLLLRVAEDIGSTLDLTETVRRVAREMCRALDADMAGVYLPTEQGTHLRPVAGYRVPRDRLEFYQDYLIPLHGHPFMEEAWETRQAVYSTDPANDPRLDPQVVADILNETTLFAPMVARDQVIGGVYVVWQTTKREFTAEELRLANAIAWQAGAVVENSQLFDEQQQRLRELGILFETSAAVSSSLALDEVLRTVARQMARALDATSCTIADWDPELNVVTPLVAQAPDPGPQDSPMTGDVGTAYALDEYPVTARVLRERTSALIRVTDAGADLAERKLLEQFGQQALLMIPLVAHDRTVGLVQLYENRAEREFTEDHVHLGTALANQAAIAIENSRLYERTDERLQARVDELTALQRVTRELNATLALDHIVDALLDAAIEATGATHGNVLLLDLMSGHLALRAARGYTDEEADSLESTLLDPSSETIVKQIATTGEPRLVEDAEREQVNVCVKPGTRSSLGVPILSEGLVVGVVNLRHMESGAFDRQSLAFVQSRVEQAALAIGNAMRFEEQLHTNETLRTRSEQMASLLEVSRKLRADVSLEETLEEVAYAIQETVGFDIVLVSVCQGVPPVMRRVAMAGLPLHQFESLQQVTQPVERFENLYRDEYRLGPCYFYPFQKRADWEEELHTLVPTAGAEEWREGQWHRHDMLLVPLRGAGGRLLGQISVDQPRDGRRPSRLTLNTLAIFANQAAIAIENANLYADAQRRAENLALINEVGRTLSQVLDPDLVLNTVVRAVCDLLQCTVSAIFQLDRRDGTLAAVASFGVPLSEMGDLRFEPGEGLVGHVATTREPLLLADTAGDPRFVEGPEPIGSMLLVPIMAGGQFMGVLTAGSPHAGALMSADQVLLSTLADQAAVALESARLFDTTQQAALRLSLLNEIGRRAAAELDAQAMLDMAVGALHQNLGFFRVAAFLVDEASDYLYVAAANEGFWPVIPPNYRLAVGEGLIGAAVAGEETVLVNDTAADERYVRAGEWHCAASLSVPIKVRDRVIGVLHTESDRLMAFRDEDAAALEIAADQLAVALQNAQLFDETQRRVAELATINEIGRAISSALDLSELYGLIYLQVSKLLDTRNFHIALLDQATDLIHVEFLVEHGQQQPPVVLASGQGLTGHLIRTGEPILLSYGSAEFLAAHGLSLEREPARSWLGVPMIAEDRPIGAIAVQSFEQDAAFDPGHLELLSTVAGQAAVAVQNALLFRERERRIGELAAVNRMARAISSTLELDELLELVYAQASTLIDTTNFSIALYDEEGDVITFPFVVDPEEREDWAPRKGRRGLTGRIIETGEPLLLPSGAAGPERDEGRAIHAGLCHSWLGVPMIAEDKVRGVIAVQSYDREHVFGRQDLEFLMTVASQSAMAVRNAQLYQQIVRFSSELEEMVEARTRDLEQALDELRVERDRVETLYRITSELGATLELERVLQRALELFAGALDIEHGSILLVDQASGLLNLRATLEEDRQLPQEGKPTRWRHGVGLAGWVLARGEPVLVDDILADDRWVRRPGKELRVRSVMSAPLSLGGGDVLGVITLGHREVGYFTPEHMQLLTAATSQIAIAVNNSDLYAFISDQADQLGSALQAQQEEAAKSRAILESIADGVLVLDDKGRVLLLNPTAEELLGFAAVALEGEHFRHMLGLGETEAHRELAQGLYRELRGQLEVEDDDEHARSASIRLSAGRRVLAVTIAPLILSLGGATGLVAALRDISREAEVERLKNEFISTVSHELRTPMTSIKGYTDLLFLGMAGGLTDAQRNFLQIIKSNADRLTALVNDILDISRIETGRIRLTIEPLDLIELIDQVVASFREQYRDEGMALIWEAPETLPAVRGDAARVTQVLSNLVANAWQYTPYGGEVSISARTVDGFVQVDVADNGIGIAPENIARIFDRFFRADHPMVQEAEGTGLGLSIVKMFVEMLGGEIWVDSTLGAGSTFSFTMPLASTDLPEPDAKLLDRELTPVTARRPKILVVEDDRDLALLLRRQLEADGYQVVLAGTGDDAIWLAREEQPQVITLDIMLPDVDGFVVLERLKDNPLTAAIPVVIASVLSGGAEHKGYSLGAVDYVVKPFAEEELLTAVRRALSTLDSTGAHRVLVVDDDADILALIREALLFHGYQVDTVSDGQAALDRIDQARPDLLLLDIRMPGMDGYDVIRHLKADESTHNIPIIVITASSVDKERDRVRVLGMAADQYMTKPLSIAGLILEIKKAIADGVSG